MDEGSRLGVLVFWASVAGFLIGVFARSLWMVGFSFAYLLMLLAAATVLLSLRNIRRGLLVAMFLCTAALGIVRMQIAIIPVDPILAGHTGRSVTVEAMVSAQPDVRDTSVRVPLHVTKLLSPTRANVQANVLAVLPAHADVSYGDTVRVWGTLVAPEAFDTGAGRSFPYPQYLAAQGITFELQRAGFEVEQGAPPFTSDPLQAFAIRVKEEYVHGLQRVLPEPESGLAAGITAGDKRSVGPELSNEFTQVGLVHIVVLSGYNITVVVNAVEWLFRQVGSSWFAKIIRFGAGGIVVAFFILMSGGAASATRAGVMALIASFARSSGRIFVASRALGVAALLIVFWNPYELAFDPSFQLSALASCGLMWLTPVCEPYVLRIPERWGLREIVSSTIATQCAVAPLLLYQNGLLTIYALPANLFALIVMPVAMLFSFIASISGILLGSLATPIALPAYALLWYVITVTHIFASFPFSSLSIGTFSPLWLVAAYLGLAWIARRANMRARVTENRTISSGFQLH